MSILEQVAYLLAIGGVLTLNFRILHMIDRTQSQRVVRYLTYLILMSTGAAISLLGLSLATSDALAFFWVRMRLLMFIGISVFGLYWVLETADLHAWTRLPRVWLIWLMPLINVLFVIFAPRHPWFIAEWGTFSHSLIRVDNIAFGAWYNFTQGYYLLAILGGILALAYRARRVAYRKNIQGAWILGGFSAVAFLTMLKAFGFFPPNAPNPFPWGGVLGGLMILRGLRSIPLSDFAPIAHELVVREMRESSIVVNNEQIIVDINPAAQQLFNGKPNPIGKPLEQYPELSEALTLEGGQQEITIGARVYLANHNEIRTKNGTQRLGRVLILSDITQRKQGELERDRLLLTLDAYARTVAHDLKNPVAVIDGYLALARSVLDDMNITHEQLHYYLARAQRSTDTMTGIINSLLLLATLRNIDEITLTPLNMQQIAQRVLERLELSIEKTRAEIHLQAEMPLALGYGHWVEEIWLNYISNALKYGGTPPVIHIGATPSVDGTFIRYTVQDNGNGISPEDQRTLFKDFGRLKQHQGVEGHGLGLVIVRQMVERMGGVVDVESVLGESTTFSFTLPKAELPAPA